MLTITKNTIDYLDGFQYKTEETTTTGGGVIDTPVPELPKGTMPLAMEQEAFLDATLDSEGATVEEPLPILQFFPTAEGFYDYQKNLYIYQYKDHLGNTRLSYAKNPTTGSVEVQDQNDYYPFGMNHLKTGVAYFGTGTWNNYKYQGQELQETGWYSFKWRNYMPDVGRFFNIDPLSEKYAYQSHYNFSENRVIDAIELEGLEKVQVNEEKPILERLQNGINDFFGGVSNYISQKLDVNREIEIGKSPERGKQLTDEKVGNIDQAKSKMVNGASEAIKGGSYASGDFLEKTGDKISIAGLVAAPFTEGASLPLVPLGERISTVGTGIKTAVNISDGNYFEIGVDLGKKLLNLGVGKISEGLLNNTFLQNPTMTNAQKAIHETVIGGTATVVSKSGEQVIDEKTKKAK